MIHDLDYTYKTSADISSTNRYSLSRLITKNKFTNLDVMDYDKVLMDYKYMESANKYELSESSQYTYHIVTLSEVNRLDIVAYKVYGNPKYWWVIAMANNITNPFILNANSYLKIPVLSELYEPRGVFNNEYRFR